MRWMMAAFYFTAGLFILQLRSVFLPIIPDFSFRPPHAVVLATGILRDRGQFSRS